VILPALGGLVADFVLTSHADVDHIGVNAAIRKAMPRAVFCAHAWDTPWIEDAGLIMSERYLGYDSDIAEWLPDAIGTCVPVDLSLQGGEIFRLGPRLTVEVLPLPGHSPGHLGVWDPRSRTAIVVDAVLGRGLLDADGNVVHPPPIVEVAAYEDAVRFLFELDPVRLLTDYYDVIEGDDVGRFLDESMAFMAAAPDVSLAQPLGLADGELRPYTSMPSELAGTLVRVLLEQGRTPSVGSTARLDSSRRRRWSWE
jgi:glyoxylase-like metal-dependent hydrolase (beta-lactamase superfamily II)